MEPIDPATEREIQIALEEYRKLEQEKQVYIQGGLAVPSIVVLGTITGISIVAQFNQWWILIALPLAQIGILAFSLFASAMSLRHGMYLAVVEKRIERLAGRKLIGWEMRGVENWPKFHMGENSIENSIPNVGISIYFFTLLVFIVLEASVSVKWYWDSGFPVDQEQIRQLVAILYLVLNLIGGALLLFYFLRLPKWAAQLHAQFSHEELFMKYMIDIFDTYVDPPILTVREEGAFHVYIRNLSRNRHEFCIPVLNMSTILPPGRSCSWRIDAARGSYECTCKSTDTDRNEVKSLLRIRPPRVPKES